MNRKIGLKRGFQSISKLVAVLALAAIGLFILPQLSMAYQGGLLEGKTITRGVDAFNRNAVDTTQMTDNNLATSGSLYSNGGFYDTAWYLFSEDVDIRSIYVKSSSSSLVLSLYNSSNTLLSSIEISSTVVNASIPEVKGVRRVALTNPSSAGVTVSEWDVYSTAQTPPQTPSGLTGTAGDTTVDLSWNINTESDFSHYNVYVDGVKTKSVNTSSITVMELTNGVEYEFTITAVDSSGNESGKSSPIKLTPVAKAPAAPANLTAAAADDNKTIILNWNIVAESSSYTVKRSETSGGPYTSIATGLSNPAYTDSKVAPGVTYYYIVTAVNEGGESAASNEASAALPAPRAVLNIVIDQETVRIGEQFTANVALKNVSDIYAEDFTVHYDNKLFEYVGFKEITGYKVYNQPSDQAGNLRFIVASQGKDYGITGEKTFLKLIFKAKATGTGKVDAVKCRIADTANEFDLEEASCLEDSVSVKNSDVNRTGEYTLLDLAIDGYYYGGPASAADPVKYQADQAGDTNVTDEDLVYIVNQMLENTNYPPNN